MADWIKDERGEVICFSLVGFDAEPMAGTACLLQLRFARDEEEVGAFLAGGPYRAIQIGLGPSACRQVAERLLDVADILERPPEASPS